MTIQKAKTPKPTTGSGYVAMVIHVPVALKKKVTWAAKKSDQSLSKFVREHLKQLVAPKRVV